MSAVIEQPDLDLILEMIRGWTRLLAEKDFDKAVEYLLPHPEVKRQHTGESLRDALARYSLAHRDAAPDDKLKYVPAITEPDEMDAMGEKMVVYKNGDQVAIEYELPIAREWSDLTAKFSLLRVPGGYGLALDDLRVL